MKFYAYRLTGNAEADTRALKAWGLGVTVTNEDGELSVEVNNPQSLGDGLPQLQVDRAGRQPGHFFNG